MPGCSALMGGRRHRKSKKTSRKGSRKSLKGGMGYGVGGDPENGGLGTAGAVVNPAWGGEVTKSGEPILDDMKGGRRRRKSRKVSKKGGKRHKKTMRGGSSQVIAARASAGFTGEGVRGMADYKDVGTPMPAGVVPA